MSDLGQDLDCVTDLAPTMRMVSGRTALAQAIARRLITPRGTLIDDPNYGFDVRQYLNDDLGPRDIGLISAGIVAQCLQDERVFAAQASVVLTAGVLVVTISLTDAAGPFKLVLGVSDVTADILKVAA